MIEARILGALDHIPAARWDALHDGRNPFVSHAFLAGMEEHGCLRETYGWTPCHVALFDGDALVAAAPGYRKRNSHGEFVFDHAWAHAYQRQDLDYFPKWLGAVPYSPVTGPRLLARDDEARRALLDQMERQMLAAGVSSLHVNFLEEAGSRVFGDPWLERTDVQFHWRDRGFGDFAGFLAALELRKRKNIRQERTRVARAGVRFRVVHGDEASAGDLDAMHAFYVRTQAMYGNHPALTADFFRHLATTMPRQLVLVLAERGGETIAGALCLRGADTLYGRYWGASEDLPGLHFETCYYQGIDYCLREGLARFEPGAQGEHKVARGFLPELTRSRHRLAAPRLAAAFSDWCAREHAANLRYRDRVLRHSPFREPVADPPPGA